MHLIFARQTLAGLTRPGVTFRAVTLRTVSSRAATFQVATLRTGRQSIFGTVVRTSREPIRSTASWAAETRPVEGQISVKA
jgi:hypothetical protein